MRGNRASKRTCYVLDDNFEYVHEPIEASVTKRVIPIPVFTRLCKEVCIENVEMMSRIRVIPDNAEKLKDK